MYLSKIYIKNFRGIKELLVEFDKKLNVIIGANGQLKTSLLDAIRLFYSWGESDRDIEIKKEDFHVEITENPDGTKTITTSTKIDICYQFEGLSAQQEGAFYQYLYRKGDGAMVARVHLSFEMKEKGRIYTSYITGKEENSIRADWNTFHYFHPYYLGALRDSTRDLMSSRNNLLGRVIKRKIDRAGSEDEVRNIVDDANDKLLQRQEVRETQTGINNNLNQINRSELHNVELHIEQNKIEYIVNIIKPFLPYSAAEKKGFILTQNSLGYNNLIYIASVLSDIKDCHTEDCVSIYSLLIEEPEAHTHPQMQYVFIKNIKRMLKNGIMRKDGVKASLQTIVSTHSSHIVADSDFDDIKYLKRLKNENSVISKNLQDLKKLYINNGKEENGKEDAKAAYRFLKQYLTLMNSELFFADKAILIEGDTERILLPLMMRKIDQDNEPNYAKGELALLSQNISVLPIGAHSHIFEKFFNFIGLDKLLILTDIDICSSDGNHKKCAYEEGKSFLTSNAALKHYFNNSDIAYYISRKAEEKRFTWNDKRKEMLQDPNGNMMVCYQTKEGNYQPRSFEDDFFQLNSDFIINSKFDESALDAKALISFKGDKNPYELANKGVKSKAALAISLILAEREDKKWKVPTYIQEGLLWVRS